MREFLKVRGKKTHNDNDIDRDRDRSSRRDKSTIFKHKERDMKDERHEEEKRIAPMSLLSAIQSEMGERVGGRMYVETEVGGNKLRWTQRGRRVHDKRT